MKDKNIELLEEINKSLKEINLRLEINDNFLESEQTKNKIERKIEHSTQQIQATFDRIHDRVFNFNNILIGAYLVLGTFPSESPMIKLWTVVFPVVNLIFMILLEIRQMKIHRFISYEENWNPINLSKHQKMIDTQTQLSLLSFAMTFGSLIYLLCEVIFG